MIAWPTGVNQLISRDSSWDLPLGVISDQTRSGKSKTRAGLTQEPITFNVTMKMTVAEYQIFKNWFLNTLRRGVLSFAFPQIDDTTGTMKEYRFVPKSKPGVNNISGDIIEISMIWEQVS